MLKMEKKSLALSQLDQIQADQMGLNQMIGVVGLLACKAYEKQFGSEQTRLALELFESQCIEGLAEALNETESAVAAGKRASEMLSRLMQVLHATL